MGPKARSLGISVFGPFLAMILFLFNNWIHDFHYITLTKNDSNLYTSTGTYEFSEV